MQKKFEEGIFSDLRNLKPLQDSTLEESRSDFLKFLYENQCIRTQKKQKVFYWFSVKHDKLFLVLNLFMIGCIRTRFETRIQWPGRHFNSSTDGGRETTMPSFDDGTSSKTINSFCESIF